MLTQCKKGYHLATILIFLYKNLDSNKNVYNFALPKDKDETK